MHSSVASITESVHSECVECFNRLHAWWMQVATRLDEVPTLLQLLGLQLDTDLLLASLLSLALTALLFAGPLFYKFPHSSESRQKQQHRSSHLQTLHALRDCVVAPLTEEWCFRACMVPLMWLEVDLAGNTNPATGHRPSSRQLRARVGAISSAHLCACSCVCADG